MDGVRVINAEHNYLGFCVECKAITYVRLMHVHGKHNGVQIGICSNCDRKVSV